MLGLYIHIPFCNHICSYCDFPKQLPNNIEQIEKYINRLCAEIDFYKDNLIKCNTIYIGGGTPNSLPLNLLEKLLFKISKCTNNVCEYSIELNPENINLELIKLLNKYHINRVSIGVQTFNNDLLKTLNRLHDQKIVIDRIMMLVDNGIHNINVDLMYGLPGQSFSDIIGDLNIVKDLPIKHISYYSLILENHTVINNLVNAGLLKLPDEDLVADMSEYINETLPQLGFDRYEISNYSKPGYESKHNLIYWDTEYYYGLGMRACGYINNERYQNQHTLKGYMSCDDFVEEWTSLTLEDQMNEYFMLGLRKIKGVSRVDFINRFNKDPFQIFNLDKLINKGLLEINEEFIRLTKRGLEIANIVFEEFI